MVSAVFLFAACKKEEVPAPAAPVVTAVKVIQQDMPWNIEYPAQIAGSLEVQIRAQVGGILKERFYNEGEFVKEGTLLFQIDDSEYKVALEKAKGSLAQAQAEEKRTKRTFERIKKLRASNAVSQQDYDNALSAYDTAKANVQVAQAAVDGAAINLGYTQVTAPISGIVGEAVPSVGSLISPAGESGYLTDMVQIDPLYAKFSMPSSQFNQLKQGFLDGQIAFGNMSSPQDTSVSAEERQEAEEKYRNADASEVAVYVEAVMPSGQIYPQRGKIIFFDSSENAQTSSIAMKAEFANPEDSRQLMPGQFVRVHLIGAVFKNAVLVPSSALLHSAQDLLAYVVKEDGTVEVRPVKADLQDDLYIVTEGLKAGETVMNEGLSRVRDGQKVTAQIQPFSLEKQTAAQAATENTPSDAKDTQAAEDVVSAVEIAATENMPSDTATAQAPAADAPVTSAQEASPAEQQGK